MPAGAASLSSSSPSAWRRAPWRWRGCLARAAAALACVSLPLFWIIERRRGDAALVPLDLFRIRPFRGAILATAAMTFGMYGMLFLLPMSWQSAGLLSAVGAGLALVPMAAIFALVSPFSGILTNKFSSRATTSGGVALIGCGLCVLAAVAGARSVLPAIIGLCLPRPRIGGAAGPRFALSAGSGAPGGAREARARNTRGRVR